MKNRNLLKKIHRNQIVKMLLIGSTICFGMLTSACTAVAIGAVAGTGAAVATDARGGSRVVDDQALSHNVGNAVDATVPHGSFTIASYDKHVLLAGRVPSAEDKEKAVQAARNTAGVTGVYNYLTVGKNEDVSGITKDTYLTSAAKGKLIAQKGVNTNNIKVVTANRVVYLLGSDAGIPHQVQKAISKIRHIDGVRKVVNLIQH